MTKFVERKKLHPVDKCCIMKLLEKPQQLKTEGTKEKYYERH